MTTLICKSCCMAEASVFMVLKGDTTVWANFPSCVLIYCQSCFDQYSSWHTTETRKKILAERLYIAKEDYLAALAMAEL